MGNKNRMKCDIVIIGGGIIGSAAAYFLAVSGRAGSIAVIEPDPGYSKASTPAGAGGVRRLMCRPENIRMSRFSLEFYAGFQDVMATADHPADIQFRREGYLFLASADGEDDLRRNFDRQIAEGVPAELLERSALRARFPSIGIDNVAVACHSPQDAWIDPHAALIGFRKKAEDLGVRYLPDRVVSLDRAGSAVSRALLQSGDQVVGDVFLNTAGAWTGEIAAMTGARLPVVPMCRVQHFWRCAHEIEPMPLVKDESGVFFRPEGRGFVGGRPSWDIAPGFIWDIHSGYFANYFEDTVWGLIAEVVPKFETIKLERSWGGHYAQNVFDGNMIIGRYSEGIENLYTACGFSGHGIMHAPAVGRALSELSLHGAFQSLDLTKLGFQRVLDDEPYGEEGIR